MAELNVDVQTGAQLEDDDPIGVSEGFASHGTPGRGQATAETLDEDTSPERHCVIYACDVVRPGAIAASSRSSADMEGRADYDRPPPLVLPAHNVAVEGDRRGRASRSRERKPFYHPLTLRLCAFMALLMFAVGMVMIIKSDKPWDSHGSKMVVLLFAGAVLVFLSVVLLFALLISAILHHRGGTRGRRRHRQRRCVYSVAEGNEENIALRKEQAERGLEAQLNRSSLARSSPPSYSDATGQAPPWTSVEMIDDSQYRIAVAASVLHSAQVAMPVSQPASSCVLGLSHSLPPPDGIDYGTQAAVLSPPPSYKDSPLPLGLDS